MFGPMKEARRTIRRRRRRRRRFSSDEINGALQYWLEIQLKLLFLTELKKKTSETLEHVR
jgi:hypothetical protein